MKKFHGGFKHSRSKESFNHSKKKFHRSSRLHPMNQAFSFVSGNGIFRNGVQV